MGATATSGPREHQASPAMVLDPAAKIYQANKIAVIVDALLREGVSPADALRGMDLSQNMLASPATRVSLNQTVQCHRNAIQMSRAPFFAYRTGLRSHISNYGMYGFALLSCTNFRHAQQFVVQYRELATPLADLSFREEGQTAICRIDPLPLPEIDPPLYRFIVEIHFGIRVSLQREIMGPRFAPERFRVTYKSTMPAQAYCDAFGCPVIFDQPANEMLFDAAWLDAVPEFGDRITYATVVELCDQLLDELQLQKGMAGQVRRVLLTNLASPRSFEAIARHLDTAPRTLRRKLQEEATSFRELLDELRRHAALKYLRDTALTIEHVAQVLGFSDAANFRHAFRRWTGRTPTEFRSGRKI